jgi:RNA polymerase sigma factor (TIGR02999 family)
MSSRRISGYLQTQPIGESRKDRRPQRRLPESETRLPAPNRRTNRVLIEPPAIACYGGLSKSHAVPLAPMSNCDVQPDLTRMLQADKPGVAVSQELLPLVYKQLRELAAARMAREMEGQTLQPTALVHEAWLRLQSNSSPVWRNRAHFFGAASEAMRRILIERARRKLRLKRGHRAEHVSIENVDVAQTEPDERILLIDEALTRLNAADPELARIVTLKFFGGLTNAEVAEASGVTERTIYNKWTFAKAWLLKKIREEWSVGS